MSQKHPRKSLSELQSLISDEDKNKIALENEKREKQAIAAREKIKELTVREMNVNCFPVFIRINYPELRDQSNAILIELGKEFKAYLENVFKGELKKGEAIWNIELGTVAWNKISDPFSVNGYHPAFAWRFCEFIEKMKKENLIQK